MADEEDKVLASVVEGVFLAMLFSRAANMTLMSSWMSCWRNDSASVHRKLFVSAAVSTAGRTLHSRRAKRSCS